MLPKPFLRPSTHHSHWGFILLIVEMLVVTASPGLRATPAQAARRADTPYLVKDIWPGSSSSEPDILTNLNGPIFFQANDGVHGWELWKSDGTEAGTQMVKDINTGAGNSNGCD